MFVKNLTHVRGLTCKRTRVRVWAAQEQLVHFKSIYWMLNQGFYNIFKSKFKTIKSL